MDRFNTTDWVAQSLVITGALNWLCVGLFQLDLVAALFGGPGALLSRIVYTLVGVAGIYALMGLTRAASRERGSAIP